MGKTSKRFSKECIEDGEFNITMMEEGLHKSLLLTMKVQNYSKLKKRIFYYKSAVGSEFKWRFELVISKGTLFVILSTNVRNKVMSFFIDNIEPTKIRASTTEEICESNPSQSVYVSEFCNRAILNPENKLLPDDVLTVKCKYDTDPAESSRLLFLFDLLDIDFDVQGDYLEYLLKTSFWADFTIHVKDDAIRVHKSVLRVYSQYLDDLFNGDHECNCREIVVDTSSHIMRCVFLYMYSGELETIEFECMLEVFSVAKELKVTSLVIELFNLSSMLDIPSLKASCIHFLEANLSSKYALRIFNAADDCEEIGLKNKAHLLLCEGKALNAKDNRKINKGIQ